MTYIIKDYYYIPYELLSHILEECEATYKSSFIVTKILSRYTDFLKDKIVGSNVTKDWIFHLMYNFIKDNVYTIKDDESFNRDPLDDKDDIQVGAVKMFTRKLISHYDPLREMKLNGMPVNASNPYETQDISPTDVISITRDELTKTVQELDGEFTDWELKCKGANPTGTNYWDGKRIGMFELRSKLEKEFLKPVGGIQKSSGCEGCNNKNPKIKRDILDRLKKLMNIGMFTFQNIHEFEAVIKDIEEEM